jgi:hypothetical protein
VLRWFRRRREAAQLAQADANALVRGHGKEVYRMARGFERDVVLPDGTTHQSRAADGADVCADARRAASPFPADLRLQKRFRPAVAPPEIVALQELLVKVLGREAVVALAIQSLYFLLPIHRNASARRLAQPAVQQAGLSVVLEAHAPASKRSLPDPEQLRRSN